MSAPLTGEYLAALRRGVLPHAEAPTVAGATPEPVRTAAALDLRTQASVVMHSNLQFASVTVRDLEEFDALAAEYARVGVVGGASWWAVQTLATGAGHWGYGRESYSAAEARARVEAALADPLVTAVAVIFGPPSLGDAQ